MEVFVGQIIPVGFNFAPVGWLMCQGQLVSISEYQVLYTLIGTTYGGDGTTTFQLPNLCGHVPINAGQGPGLATYVMGQQRGTEGVTLTSAQNGAHNHACNASRNAANSTTPGSTMALGVASAGNQIFLYASPGQPNTNL